MSADVGASGHGDNSANRFEVLVLLSYYQLYVVLNVATGINRYV